MAMDLDALEREMTAWRRDLHAHPEFGFEEKRTSAFVAAKLREFGLDEVAEGIGGTGVVGTLKRGSGNRAIALRADMDALRITEQGTQAYRSQNPARCTPAAMTVTRRCCSGPRSSSPRKAGSMAPCALSSSLPRNGARARSPCWPMD